jgi:hypothetical protein
MKDSPNRYPRQSKNIELDGFTAVSVGGSLPWLLSTVRNVAILDAYSEETVFNLITFTFKLNIFKFSFLDMNSWFIHMLFIMKRNETLILSFTLNYLTYAYTVGRQSVSVKHLRLRCVCIVGSSYWQNLSVTTLSWRGYLKVVTPIRMFK